MLKIAILGGSLYLLLNLYACYISDGLIFRPRPKEFDRLPNEVKISTGDGQQISAVYLENSNAEFTLLFSHGNAENLDNVAPFMAQFHQLGYSVLMYDYRGYGLSDGTPSTSRAKTDVLAAYHWLTEEKGIAPKTIVSHGRSLGGAVATWLASKKEVGALIVESSFVSAFRVKTVVPLLPWDKFNSLKAIKSVNCPVLVMHGTHDDMLPFWHGQKLYAAAPEPKQHLWIENGEHNNYAYVAEEAYLESIQSFMESVREYHKTRAE